MSEERKIRTSRFKNWYLILCAFGILFALLSVNVHYTNELGVLDGKSFCTINDTVNCDEVVQSKWSSFFGVPLGVYGVAYYVFSAILVLFASPACIAFLFYLSVINVILSVFLFYVSSVLIGAVCILCLGMYLVHLLQLFVAWRAKDLEPELNLESLTVPLTKALIGAVLVFVLTLVLAPKIAVWGKSSSSSMETKKLIALWSARTKQEIPLKLAEAGMDVDFYMGSPNAPVQIVEFSDYECPYCKLFFLEAKELLKEYGEDKLLVVHKNYPLDNACNSSLPAEVHQNACFASYFTRCAGEQGRFWDAAEYVYNLPEIESGGAKRAVQAAIAQGALKLNLDAKAIDECLSSGRQKKNVERDIAAAEDLGLIATPSVWINGRKLDEVSPEHLRAIIDYLLSNQP